MPRRHQTSGSEDIGPERQGTELPSGLESFRFRDRCGTPGTPLVGETELRVQRNRGSSSLQGKDPREGSWAETPQPLLVSSRVTQYLQVRKPPETRGEGHQPQGPQVTCLCSQPQARPAKTITHGALGAVLEKVLRQQWGTASSRPSIAPNHPTKEMKDPRRIKVYPRTKHQNICGNTKVPNIQQCKLHRFSSMQRMRITSPIMRRIVIQ